LEGILKQRDRSWLSLLAFFAAVTLTSSLVFAAVFAGVTIAIADGEAPQVPEDRQVDPVVPGQTFAGIITDAHCGPRHKDSDKSAAECARMCVRDASKYIIVDGDRIFQLAGNQWQFGQLAGQRVNLTDVLSEGAIKVSSARPLVANVGE